MRILLLLWILIVPGALWAQQEHSAHETSGHGHESVAAEAGHNTTHMGATHPETVPQPHADADPAGRDNRSAETSDQGNVAHVHPSVSTEQVPGVEEKLGRQVALDAVFVDEHGVRVTMAQIIDKPTIIVPIYFNCPNVCAIIQSNLAGVLPDVKLTPGKDFQVVSVSFDDTDTAQAALDAKRNYMAAMDFAFPEAGWRFLTGDERNIRIFLDSLGFGFKRQGKDFVHPVVIMAVTPKGMVARYLYGVKPLAFDLTMAATEASKEHTGLSVKRVLAYCFSYDPAGKRYVFNFMKITGAGILVILAVLLFSLLVAGRKKRPPRH